VNSPQCDGRSPLDITVDPLSEVPIYQQIRDRVVEAIAAGDLTRGQGLASVRSVSAEFGINPATVAKAYELLRSEGLVATNSRSGSTIARDPASGPPADAFGEYWRGRLRTLLAEAHVQGLTSAAIIANCAAVVSDFTGVNSGGNEKCSGST
jgi:DNA-binding transcriptional regulator YhcF (GntR family)